MKKDTRIGPLKFGSASKDAHIAFIGGSIGEEHFKCEGETVKIVRAEDTEDCPKYAARRLWYWDGGRVMVSVAIR